MNDSPILLEQSRGLFVEGGSIRIRRNSKGAFNMFGKWTFYKLDLRKPFFKARHLKKMLKLKWKLLCLFNGRMSSDAAAQCTLF